jgi:hypothetical protein
MSHCALWQIPVLLGLSHTILLAAEPVVVDFEQATLIFAGERPNRVEQWVEKGVLFRLAHEPTKSKAKGLLMFFPHLASGHKGIVCAMALEPIPVRATLPQQASSVSVAFWGSTETPAVLEAFDAEGKLVDRAALASVPGRKAPADPIPIFTMTVKAPSIAYIEFSGPREGEFLAADEVRFTPIATGTGKP